MLPSDPLRISMGVEMILVEKDHYSMNTGPRSI